MGEYQIEGGKIIVSHGINEEHSTTEFRKTKSILRSHNERT